jgi:hypothetical protein
MEQRAVSFPSFGEALDSTPDLDLPDPSSASPDAHLLVAEAMFACTSGMLLCLDREQRLTYILGEIFGVTDTVAAELLEISSENFRQRLARARRDLHNFMNDKCGLVNRDNPCRCAKKTRGFIDAGHVDPENLLFARDRVRQVREVVPEAYETIKTLDEQCANIYRQHPFYESPALVQMLDDWSRAPVSDGRQTLPDGRRRQGGNEWIEPLGPDGRPPYAAYQQKAERRIPVVVLKRVPLRRGSILVSQSPGRLG